MSHKCSTLFLRIVVDRTSITRVFTSLLLYTTADLDATLQYTGHGSPSSEKQFTKHSIIFVLGLINLVLPSMGSTSPKNFLDKDQALALYQFLLENTVKGWLRMGTVNEAAELTRSLMCVGMILLYREMDGRSSLLINRPTLLTGTFRTLDFFSIYSVTRANEECKSGD